MGDIGEGIAQGIKILVVGALVVGVLIGGAIGLAIHYLA